MSDSFADIVQRYEEAHAELSAMGGYEDEYPDRYQMLLDEFDAARAAYDEAVARGMSLADEGEPLTCSEGEILPLQCEPESRETRVCGAGDTIYMGPAGPTVRGQFGTEAARCGDTVQLIARRIDMEGADVIFTLASPPGGDMQGQFEPAMSGEPATYDWVTQKPNDDWPDPKMDFEVSAGGVQGRSANQFEFIEYTNVAKQTKTIPCSSPPYGWTAKFDAEIRGHKLHITTKIKLLNKLGAKGATPEPAVGPPVSAADKAMMKADIEGKLNNRWNQHRQGCGRGQACDCPGARGCCKLETIIRVQFVESGEHHVVNLYQGAGRASATNWTRTKTRANSWAHETGHLLGWYDEYAGGAVGSAPRWKIQTPVVMNTGLTVPKEYYWDFRDWVGSKTSERWDLVSP